MLRRVILLSFILAAASLGGPTACGGGSPTGDDNGNDAAVSEDASPLRDSGTVPDSSIKDGGNDDAGNDPDMDQDGYPASQDCFDYDPAIYPGVTRPCQSACDVGTETCLPDATWSECTASTDCNCTPGMTRVIPCGNCGQQGQVCGNDSIWADQGACINEGPCSPGQQDQVTCPLCGSGARLCQNDCQWGPPDCTGDCVPGTTETTSAGCVNSWEVQERLCDTLCQWTALAPCSGQCIVTPRQDSGMYDGEICIPGSEFIRGRPNGEGSADENPAQTIALTPYLIDEHEVTNGRYRQCVTANACNPPMAGSDYYDYYNSRPVAGVSYQNALTFCAWDGGRTLPTEAQWEKAARGPYPREVLNPWGSDPATCELVGGEPCNPGLFGTYHSDDVGMHPLGASYYAVQDMANNVSEWVRDWYDATYYSTGPYLDPLGPLTGTTRVRRGLNFAFGPSGYTDSVTRRVDLDPTHRSELTGFRCARVGY